MFVHKQVNITYCQMMKMSHAELQQLKTKTKYYTQSTSTLRNNQERLIILVDDLVDLEIGTQCI